MTAPFPARPLWCAVALLCGAPLPARAGASAASGSQLQQPDSAAALRAARRAQAGFERVRRGSLPVVDVRARQECDAVVGRYCYWHEPDAQPRIPPERPQVTRARRTLLQTLDSLAGVVPANGWILGQRVRYRLEAGDTASAVRTAAAACRTPGWWCPAVAGYARHLAGDYALASQAFAAARAAMDERQRCDWDTPALLLEPADRRRLLEVPCAVRGPVNERVWWLATPLLTGEANDVRTEYHARHVAVALETDARHLYDGPTGWDMRELLLRYGAPVWWTRERAASAAGMTASHLTGHEAAPSFDFMPASRLVFDTMTAARADDWELGRTRPVSRYAPAYAASWSSAGAQVARFLRGDSLLVVARYTAHGDTALRDPLAQLVVSPAPLAPLHASRPTRGTSGVLEAVLPRTALRTPGLASVEVVDTASRAVARYRAGIAPLEGGRLVLSDLLLHSRLDPIAGVPALREVAPAALDELVVRGTRVGIYWETYGIPPGGELLDVAITVERTGIPWLRRAAERVGLGAPASPLQVRWRGAPGEDGGAAAQSVIVHVGGLAPGEYLVTLTVRGDDGATAASTRRIDVRR